jgi:hypothetical protein
MDDGSPPDDQGNDDGEDGDGPVDDRFRSGRPGSPRDDGTEGVDPDADTSHRSDRDGGRESGPADHLDPAGAPLPIGSVPLRVAGAKASVSPERLPDLLREVQAEVEPRVADYRRRFECVYEDDDRAVFLVPREHWSRIGERLGFRRREADAVRRAHEEQLRYLGGGTGRREEFETALEIREAVVIGLDD